LNADSKGAIANRYMIVFKSNVSHEEVAAHMRVLSKRIHLDQRSGEMQVPSSVLSSFQIADFRGFSAVLARHILEEELLSDIVDYIEADQEVHALQSCSSQSNAVWGLDRIGERALDLDMIYRYGTNAGLGVTVYIVDTGINLKHVEFQGRASWGANFVDTNNDDCNGHGTHVAGTVGGVTYGVAKKVTLVAVKVLNCMGSGTITGVVDGINYVAQQYQSTKKPSLANMSLGGSKSTTLDKAVESAVGAGVTFVVAAGNENQDACNVSPGGSAAAVSVGATTIVDATGTEEDQRSSFSNYGTCVSLFAPGELIESAWIGSTTAVKTISGTSMASPHVCGAGAVYLSSNTGKTPSEVKQFLTTDATADVINLACRTLGTCRDSPNKLLYSPC